jgi:dipicolinate synthase subunit A
VGSLNTAEFSQSEDRHSIVSVFLGGDGREKETAFVLTRISRELRGVKSPFISRAVNDKMVACMRTELPEAFSAGDNERVVVIGPVQGIKNDGSFVQDTDIGDMATLEASDIEYLPRGSMFMAGTLPAWAKELMADRGIHVFEFLSSDEFAFYNAVPTAEGAVCLAISNTSFSIFRSGVAVLGFGRTGLVLANTLKSLGANVTVVARGSRARSQAWALGYRAVDFQSFESEPFFADIIFNTVPALVLRSEIISGLREGCVIIDLASYPGGTDFEAAARLGVKAILAPGLPARFAPETAGKILAAVVIDFMAKTWKDLAPKLDRVGGGLI